MKKILENDGFLLRAFDGFYSGSGVLIYNFEFKRGYDE